ncbi:hypothetical protein CEXT_423341 [Caerostris extrusa]|uniref:Uncharacterized protein n=1 Tax=Caerostris extrusa TaxID=172846 RepID=A0AAV4W0E5_CAEEX|nr:hypothetical protein CEXT_423341 [Caerostris extrusa]
MDDLQRKSPFNVWEENQFGKKYILVNIIILKRQYLLHHSKPIKTTLRCILNTDNTMKKRALGGGFITRRKSPPRFGMEDCFNTLLVGGKKISRIQGRCFLWCKP